MASLAEYMSKMRDWQEEYELPDAILPLFNALFQKQQEGNPNYLTLMMRGSLDNQELVLDFVGQLLAEVMAKRHDPAIVSNCMEMIQSCRQILNATTLVRADHFQFMKLPLELRHRVYKHYIADLFPSCEPRPIGGLERSECGCPRHSCLERRGFIAPLGINLCLTSSKIRDEFLANWFESNVFSFRCCCDLLDHLTNKALRHNIRNFRVHWSGERSADAFKLLQEVARMHCVTILVSINTAKFKSGREQELGKHFIHHSRPFRYHLTDACGFDELAELAQYVGLDKVRIDYSFDDHPSNQRNVEGLRSYLKSKCETSEENT